MTMHDYTYTCQNAFSFCSCLMEVFAYMLRLKNNMVLSAAECCQCVVCVFFSSGAVILLGRTNMFRFNHPKEAAKLREKRKVRLNQCLVNLNLFTILFLI